MSEPLYRQLEPELRERAVGLTLSVQMRGKLVVMRLGAVLLAVVVALAAGAVSIRGAVAASQRAAKPVVLGAESPSWSPDGKQIAFLSVRYRLEKQCTKPCDVPPALAPSEWRIVRTSSKPGGAIHTVYTGRKGESLPWGSMQWTEGGRIVFSSNALLLSMSVHGGKPEKLYPPSCRPRGPGNPQCFPEAFILSPNHKIAAVTLFDSTPSPGTIALAKVNTAKPAMLPTPPQAFFPGFALAFSPDSKRLVFGSCQPDPQNLYACTANPLMAVSIGSRKSIPLPQSGIPGAGLVPNNASQVQWSPDGRWVAFVENQSLEVAQTAGASEPRVLASCPNPEVPADFSWSPTSTMIAVDCRNPGNGSSQISTVRPDGTHLTDLLHDRPLVYDISEAGSGPQWSPNGSRLLILAHRIGHRTIHVWTIRPNGQNLTRRG